MQSLRYTTSRPQSSATLLIVLYATTMLLSATLLFVIQPMFTKMVLPMLGGSPSVWNSAMLFFQMMLLAGYAYAHVTTKLLSWRRQVTLHAAILIAAYVFLPIAPKAGWIPPTDEMPVFWLIGLFSVSIGLPFFIVSATAPMLQRWFATSSHPAASDPYFLYGASNLGSITALVAYPTVIEPLLGIPQQSHAWTAGYAALVILIGFCALSIRQSAETGSQPSTIGISGAVARTSWRLRLQWVVYAFVPSSLMLGVTTHISTDVAAVPLLWVVPLTLYLLSFVIVFSRKPILKQRWMVRVLPYFMLLAAYDVVGTRSAWLYSFSLSVATFFVCAMVLHSELVRRRPAASDLTEFYLVMSFGGMLGGVFNALLAPVLFDTVIEYPLMLVVTCLLIPTNSERPGKSWPLDVFFPLLVLVALAAPTLFPGFETPNFQSPGMVVLLIGLSLLLFSFKKHALRFALGIGAFMIGVSALSQTSDLLLVDRSFFGVHRVYDRDNGKMHVLFHGTTIHGAQQTDPKMRRQHLTYYYPEGPFGQIFRAYSHSPIAKSVGVIGLGAGSMACYRQPDASWTFYEIDPVVIDIARHSGMFDFLSACAPDARIVPGDARLSLRAAPPHGYGMLFLDAFSSDAIPVHLLTREAILSYLDKLVPGGVLVFHVSNNHLNLTPVLVGLANDIGLTGRAIRYIPEVVDVDKLNAVPVSMVVLARKESDLKPLAAMPGWLRLGTIDGAPAWTDNYSNIVGSIRFDK